ncbi:hypothetical protein GCM10022407_14280 [Hymenobacter antarcticus]|uniref:Uncharacterized protein n=1 Tax=Hymenobacter antarcticus TaxID=486270 RepID=A0ABP7PQG0_9BACT
MKVTIVKGLSSMIRIVSFRFIVLQRPEQVNLGLHSLQFFCGSRVRLSVYSALQTEAAEVPESDFGRFAGCEVQFKIVDEVGGIIKV